MNLLGKLQSQYDQLWKQIIRPQRSHYSQENLGPKQFALEGQNIRRQDFQLMNIKGLVYQSSVWIPQNIENQSCIIYLHGSDGNRTQGMQYLGKIMKCGVALCTFDFCGCGNAEGQFISMGYFEQQQLNDVVSHLKNKIQLKNICLWGKYLGAVTAMLYLPRQTDIKAVIFDNPYKNVKSVIQGMLNQTKVPSFMVGGAAKIIAKSVQDKADFDINNVNPAKNVAPGLSCPAFFIASVNDQTINLQSTKDLYSVYGGQQKHLCLVKGKINDTRTEQCINDCLHFFMKHVSNSLDQGQKTTKKQFDFFQMRKSIRQKTIIQQEFRYQQKQTNVDFFAQPDIKSAPQKKKENEKQDKQFSLKGLMSIFTRENPKKQQKQEREPQRQEQQINDKYKELRKRLELSQKETANSKNINQQKIHKLTKKMRSELSDVRQNIHDEGNLRKWIYVSL